MFNTWRPALVTFTATLMLTAAPGRAQEPQDSDAKPAQSAQPPSEPPKSAEPFAFADFTWLSGNPRTKESPIDSKVFTGEFRVDTNFTYSFNKPVDDTIG